MWCACTLFAREGGDRGETVGCHHWLNGHEFEQIQEDSEGQGSLACCNSWGHKELDLGTEQQKQYRKLGKLLNHF